MNDVQARSNRFTIARRVLRSNTVRLFVVTTALLGAKACSFWRYAPSDVQVTSPDVREDLLRRKSYLAHRLGTLEGTGAMPAILGDQFQGEWAAVTYSMTAMAAANLAFMIPESRAESVALVDMLAHRMLDADTRAFDAKRWGEDPLEALNGDAGHVGYLGHLTLVLLAQAYIGGSCEHAAVLRAVVTALRDRLLRSAVLHAETYPGETYVPDNAVVIGALALADRLEPELQADITDRWVAMARSRFLDASTGTLVFRITPQGQVLQSSRGSGVAWSVFYLSYADELLAAEQHKLAWAQLGDRVVASRVWGLREYPRGDGRGGDVDSGPLILGLSPSGTGFATAGAALVRDQESLRELLRTAELAGTTVDTGTGRRYLFAPLVGDAILLAMRTVTRWEVGGRRWCAGE